MTFLVPYVALTAGLAVAGYAAMAALLLAILAGAILLTTTTEPRP